jgi:hypothetical protein
LLWDLPGHIIGFNLTQGDTHERGADMNIGLPELLLFLLGLALLVFLVVLITVVVRVVNNRLDRSEKRRDTGG